MVMINIKLKEDSTRQFLTTPSGYTITKDEFVEVDDEDKTIHAYIINRRHIIMKEVTEEAKIEEPKEEIIEKPKEEIIEEPKEEKIKLNEGKVQETIVDEDFKNESVFED